MLDGARFNDARARRAPLGARARPSDENLPMGSNAMEGGARRGIPMRGLGVVGRGEPRLVREHASSAPRVITVPNEFTKECLWSGSAPPNGARWRKDVGRSPCPATGTTLRFP